MIVHRVAKNQKQLKLLITHAYVYIYPFLLKPPSFLPSHPSRLSKTLGWAPCVIQQPHISYLFYL